MNTQTIKNKAYFERRYSQIASRYSQINPRPFAFDLRKSAFKALCLVTILVFGLIGLVKAEEERLERVSKQISGEISGISSNFIAVVYGSDSQTSYEMALNIGKDVKLEYIKSLSEIGVGDTVKVTYDALYQIDKEGKKRLINNEPKKISFVRKATKAPETDALTSEKEQVITPEADDSQSQEVTNETAN
jgi:hypothetical protein